MDERVNVVCMKWGTKYDFHYVNTLYRMVRRHLTLPFRFVCLTDDPQGIIDEVETFPIPTFKRTKTYDDSKIDRGWNKLLTFSSPLYDLKGVALFLDLDLVIVDNIDAFFTIPGDFLIIQDWLKPDLTGNSSIYRFEIGRYGAIIDDFLTHEDDIRRIHRNEQEYLTAYMKQQGVLSYWPDEMVKSFKRHCLRSWLFSWFLEPILPQKAKIVVFHGKPNPKNALLGNSGKWFRKIRPTRWVAQYWQ